MDVCTCLCVRLFLTAVHFTHPALGGQWELGHLSLLHAMNTLQENIRSHLW